jgi:DNA (cytosine-5)-methyltransferase 1
VLSTSTATGRRSYKKNMPNPSHYLQELNRGRPVSAGGDTGGTVGVAAEFFAGIGLVRLALEQRGWRVAFANDIDEDKAEMYRANWAEGDQGEHLHVGDIHQIDAKDVPTCDLFTASFPCNDLSVAGKREGLAGKESSAFWGLVRILKEMGNRKPKLVMLENVVGFLTSHDGADLEQALLALNELGYGVDAFILNAMHWVPQSRARMFIVAKRDSEKSVWPFAAESDTRPSRLIQFINGHPNIAWSIRELPGLPGVKAKLTDILEDLPENDEQWWSEERVAYFLNQLSERHGEIAKTMIAGKKFSYATAFRRVRKNKSMAELRTDGIAGCLRTPRGGSGRQILFRGGKGTARVRLLTARECARLQGVPDSFKIEATLNKALFGFGDAVCVPAIEWIAENYLNLELEK